MRQVFSAQLLEPSGYRVEDIHREFSKLVELHLGLNSADAELLSDTLFGPVVELCRIALIKAVDRGQLVAHETLSSARHNILLSELAAVRRNVDLLLTRTNTQFSDYLNFEIRYRGQVAARHGYITPPFTDFARKLPIDSQYVSPMLRSVDWGSGSLELPRTLSSFVGLVYRTVLLGDPGGGKSTLAEKVAHDLAISGEVALPDRTFTPILVVLRDYASSKRQRRCSILDFVEESARALYQITPPEGCFEYLLLNGRAFVIFDGLDELLDTSSRREISGDVEAFVNLYPLAPVLVTSRVVGYEQAPLDHRAFTVFALQAFDEGKIKEYSTKWFSLNSTESLENERLRRAEAFLRESTIAPDLRSNPLLLGLMCNLYRGMGYIPKNRPDVFGKCAEMLFERWDRSRGIYPIIASEALLKPCLMYLAHYIYSETGLRSGITETRLLKVCTRYLIQHRFGNTDGAERSATEFIEFFRGRAWVFTDTGTNATGERLYQFTHATFLEYFTALHLIRLAKTPEELLDRILPRIESREWDNVMQLTTQAYDRLVEGGGELIIDRLLRTAEIKKPTASSLNRLLFAGRTLQFLNPSAAGVSRTVRTCFEFVRYAIRNPLIEERAACEPLIAEILSCSDENRQFVAEEYTRYVSELFRSDDLRNFVVEIAYIPEFLGLSQQPDGGDARAFWTSVSHELFHAHSASICSVAETNQLVGILALKRGVLQLESFLERFGIAGVFQKSRYAVFVDHVVHSPAITVLLGLYSIEPPIAESAARTLAKAFGEVAVRTSTPWFLGSNNTLDNLTPLWAAANLLDLPRLVRTNSEPAVQFGALALLIGLLDGAGRASVAEDASFPPFFHEFRHLLQVRYRLASLTEAQRELKRSGFSPAQTEFLTAWATGRLTTVGWLPTGYYSDDEA